MTQTQEQALYELLKANAKEHKRLSRELDALGSAVGKAEATTDNAVAEGADLPDDDVGC